MSTSGAYMHIYKKRFKQCSEVFRVQGLYFLSLLINVCFFDIINRIIYSHFLSLCVYVCVRARTCAHVYPFKWPSRNQRTTSSILLSWSHAQSFETLAVELLIFQLGLQPAKPPRTFISSPPISAAVWVNVGHTQLFYMDVEIQIQILVFHNRRSFSYHPPLNTGSHGVAIVGLEFSM